LAGFQVIPEAVSEVREKATKNAVLLTLTVVAGFSQQQPKFEMADVHFSTTVHGATQNLGGVLREGRYINRDATMLQLFEAAWGVPEDTISGGPSWVSLDLFDVVAKVPNGTTPETANLMLQNLLADRFGLVINQGLHPVPRYVLSLMKGGSIPHRICAILPAMLRFNGGPDVGRHRACPGAASRLLCR
jgi:hypothetical protein